MIIAFVPSQEEYTLKGGFSNFKQTSVRVVMGWAGEWMMVEGEKFSEEAPFWENLHSSVEVFR